MRHLSLLLFISIFGLLAGCSDQQKSSNQTSELEQIILKIQSGEKTINAPQNILEDAQMLLDRSYAYGYKLIDAKTFLKMNKEKQVILIDTSAKGQYLLKHLEGAKHFEFDNSSLSLNGELVWNPKYGSKEQFLTKASQNLFATLVFYDQTQTLPHQASPADIASMWAKKLGYHNVYRLIGNVSSWESQGLQMTNETPKCCQ